MSFTGHAQLNHRFNHVTREWEPDCPKNQVLIGKIYGVATTYTGYIKESNEVDLSPYKKISFFIDHGPYAAGTPACGTEYRVEVSPDSSGHGLWTPIAAFRSGLSPAASGRTGWVNAGAVDIDMNPTAGYTLASYVFLRNYISIGNSEWMRLESIVTNTKLVMQQSLTYTHYSSVVWSEARRFVTAFDTDGFARARVVCDNSIHPSCLSSYWRVYAVGDK